MTEEQKAAWLKVAMAAGIVYIAYKFAPNNAVKAMALGVGGVIASKQIPLVREVV